MLPSSSSSSDGPRSSPLRRYGPIGVIVVLAIVIAIVVVATRGSSKKSSSSTASNAPIAATGAIPFDKNNKSVTYPSTCDTSTGDVAIPTSYPTPCFANQPAVTDPNTPGVTNDSINVVVYLAPQTDPILNFIDAAINNNETPDQIQATYTTYNALYQQFYQTYGRKVNLEFLHASGTSDDAVAARADAVKAATQLNAFAVWGGPVLTNAWTNELNARGVECLACFNVDNPAPNAFSLAPSSEQSREQLTEYVSKRLNNKPAQFAGDPALTTQNRVFGELYIQTAGGTEQQNAADLKNKFNAAGVKLDTQIGYQLDPSSLQEQATSIISRLKSAGVTSVILQADPVAPATFTREATAQNYHPEWILGPSTLVDTAAFGRTYDQTQWAHAFGMSYLTARIDPKQNDAYALYSWFTGGQDPPAPITAPTLWPQPALFYAALQAAGPHLNATNFRNGLFSLPPVTGRVLTDSITYGQHGLWPASLGDDYNGIDDFTEVWWNATAQGPDEVRRNGAGLYEYSEGGKRFLPGQVTPDTHAFDPNGAVTIYQNPPPNELAKQYPSPASGAPPASSSSAN